MPDPEPFDISHLEASEHRRIVRGEYTAEERDKLKRGENPWPKPAPKKRASRPDVGSPSEEYFKRERIKQAVQSNQPPEPEDLERWEHREWYQQLLADRQAASSKPQDKKSEQGDLPLYTGTRVVGQVADRDTDKPRSSGMQALEDEVDRATKVMGEAAEILRRKTPEPEREKPDVLTKHPHPEIDKGDSESWFRQNALLLAGLLGEAMFQLILQKGWLNSVPDPLVGLLCVIPILLAVYGFWHHPGIQRLTRLFYNRRPRMLTLTLIIVGAVLGGSLGAFGAWTIKRQQQIPGPVRQEEANKSSQVPATAPAKQGEIVDQRQRRLTEEQKKQLIKILTPHMDPPAGSGLVRIRYRIDDYEAREFIKDFQDIFRIVGWKHELEPMDFINPSEAGLSIASRWNEPTPGRGTILADALQRIGLKVQLLKTRSNLREDDIALIVGPNF